jgi:hypothetical protein
VWLHGLWAGAGRGGRVNSGADGISMAWALLRADGWKFVRRSCRVQNGLSIVAVYICLQG